MEINDPVILDKMKSVKTKIQKLIEQGRLQDAKDALGNYEKMISDDIDVYSMRSVISIMEGNIDEAESIILDGLKNDSCIFDLLFNLAYIYEQQAKCQEAADMYSKADTVADTDENKLNVKNALDNIKNSDNNITFKEKKRLVFFVKRGMDSFIDDIITGLSVDYWTRKIIVDNYKQIDKGMEWADVCWFEWCDELVAYASNSNLSIEKTVVCRLHSYEAFTDYPKNVNWDNVDKLICVAEHIKDNVLSKIGISEDKVSVIYNSIDLDKFTFKKREKGFNIAYAGYINYKKGPMLLLQAFKAINDFDNRYVLHIAGKFQDERDELYFEQMADELQLRNNIKFDGWRTDINKWLEDKNYIICTSLLESQSLSVMQAMAKGIKPLIHNFVGARHIYPSGLIWNTIDEAVKLVISDDYETDLYHKYINTRYSQDIIRYEIKDTLLKLENNNMISASSKPLVTIGVMCYNHIRYIDECMSSILNQTYPNKEIIIVDDFSTDGCIEKITTYTKEYNEVKAILHEKNTGNSCYSYKDIIEAASGEYFVFIATDDYFPDKYVIDNYMKELIKNPSLDYVYGNLRIVDTFGNTKNVWRYKQFTRQEVVTSTFRSYGSGVLGMTGMHKKEFYTKNGLTWLIQKDNKVGTDTVTALQNMKYGFEIKHINKDILCYRHHDSNITLNLKDRIMSIVCSLEYTIENFSEDVYFPEVEWGILTPSDKQAFKMYLIGLHYTDTYIYYINDYIPWNSKEYKVNRSDVIEYSKLLKDKALLYFGLSLKENNAYYNEILELKRRMETVT